MSDIPANSEDHEIEKRGKQVNVRGTSRAEPVWVNIGGVNLNSRIDTSSAKRTKTQPTNLQQAAGN